MLCNRFSDKMLVIRLSNIIFCSRVSFFFFSLSLLLSCFMLLFIPVFVEWKARRIRNPDVAIMTAIIFVLVIYRCVCIAFLCQFLCSFVGLSSYTHKEYIISSTMYTIKREILEYSMPLLSFFLVCLCVCIHGHFTFYQNRNLYINATLLNQMRFCLICQILLRFSAFCILRKTSITL